MRPLFVFLLLNSIYIMCLYPKLILNKKYMPNKKNGYNPPECTDERLKYVSVGCGNCVECRKQKAREWLIRLSEEIKIHKCKYFVTLTFSEEKIAQLASICKSTDNNIIAAKATRLFLERYRKKNKHSLKHWLITELGHEGTERIHLHGIIFSDTEITKEELQGYWKYGYADNGKYVNERTINYITKYVTKLDADHKGYIPQIFCSAGIGRSYTNSTDFELRKYKGTKTIEYYTLSNGTKVNLPIYYRNKLYTEEEREKLWIQKIEQGYTFVRGIKIRLKSDKDIQTYLDILHEQQRENVQLGYGDDSENWKRKVYHAKLRRINKVTKYKKVKIESPLGKINKKHIDLKSLDCKSIEKCSKLNIN